MELMVHSLYLSRDPLDVESGRRVVDELGPDGLVEGALEANLLGFGWDCPGDEVERPWAHDDELTELSEDGGFARFDGSAETLAVLQEDRPEAASRYREYIRLSALRWLDNLAILASGQDPWFESRLANRLAVEPRGTLLMVPEHFSANLTISTVYGEIVEAAGLAFPTVAEAAGALSLDRCRIRIDAVDS